MKDLTTGSILKHVLSMAAPAVISMLAQVAYQLIDLYFVTEIGPAATAGVNAGGAALLIVAAVMQVLGVGTVALVSHAVGRRDQQDANVIFNQSITLSTVSAVATLISLYLVIGPYLRFVSADSATIDAGLTFVLSVLPGYVFVLPMTVLISSLRGIGVVRPPIVIYIGTIIVNAVLAPILIAGWLTDVPLGIMGAGLATSTSVILGTIFLGVYFRRCQGYMNIDRHLLRPKPEHWRRIIGVGLPAGGEFFLMFLFGAVTFFVIRHAGSSAQAGYSIGSRIMQTILLPTLAIGFAIAPIVGQNFGARKVERVLASFRTAVTLATSAMLIAAILTNCLSRHLVSIFNADGPTSATAVLFLQLMSWGFVAQGLSQACSAVFQGLGNTVPPLISLSTSFVLFSAPVLWLSYRPEFKLEQVWYLAVGSAAIQAATSFWLLRSELRKRLPPISA